MVTEHERAMSRDWTNQTHAMLTDAKATRATSTKLRGQAVATRRALEKQTRVHQASVDDALRRKVQDTTHLKNKIEKRIASLHTEMEKLTAVQNRGLQMVRSLNKPIKKAEGRLRLREKRPVREKIYDKVEKALAEELDELKKSHATLDSLVKETQHHLQAMDECKHALKSDHLDKSQSLKLDLECLDLPAKTAGLDSTLGATGQPTADPLHTAHASKSTTLPSIWRQNTERVTNHSCRLEHESYELRRKLVATMHHVDEAKDSTHNIVQDALGTKVKQTTTLHNKLSQNLLDVKSEIESLDEQRDSVMRTLQAKEVPLNIVKDRLTIRRNRPARESVRDTVEEALEDEYNKLSQAIRSLQAKAAHITNERDHLMQAQNQIGQNMRDKNMSLTIDKRCLDLDQQTSSVFSASLDSQSSLKTPRQKMRQARADGFKNSRHIPRPPPPAGASMSRRHIHV